MTRAMPRAKRRQSRFTLDSRIALPVEAGRLRPRIARASGVPRAWKECQRWRWRYANWSTVLGSWRTSGMRVVRRNCRSLTHRRSDLCSSCVQIGVADSSEACELEERQMIAGIANRVANMGLDCQRFCALIAVCSIAEVLMRAPPSVASSASSGVTDRQASPRRSTPPRSPSRSGLDSASRRAGCIRWKKTPMRQIIYRLEGYPFLLPGAVSASSFLPAVLFITALAIDEELLEHGRWEQPGHSRIVIKIEEPGQPIIADVERGLLRRRIARNCPVGPASPVRCSCRPGAAIVALARARKVSGRGARVELHAQTAAPSAAEGVALQYRHERKRSGG